MAKKNKTRSVRNKITLWFITFSLLPFIFNFVTYYQRVQIVQASAREKLTSIRSLKLQQLQNWFVNKHNSSRLIATLPPLKKFEDLNFETSIKEKTNLIAIATQALNENKAIQKDIKNIYFVDRNNNNVLVSTNTSTVGIDLSNNQVYQTIVENDGHYHSSIYYSELEKTNTITFSCPVYCDLHDKSHLLGYLLSNIDLEQELYPLLLNRSGLGETGETLIVNEDGIAQSELRWYYHAPQRLKINAEPAVLAASGSTGTVISKDYRGERTIAAFTYLPEQKWGFIVKQDVSEVNEPLSRLFVGSFMLFLVFGVIAVGAAFYISRSITNPFIEIDNVVERIRAGDYSARSKIKTHDEFGSLSSIINDMAERTEERIFIRNSINELSAAVLRATTINEFGETVLKLLSKYTGAYAGGFFILNEDSSKYIPTSSCGVEIEKLKPISFKYPNKTFKVAIKKQIPKLVLDLPKNCMFKNLDKNLIPNEIYTLPIVSELNTVALIGLASEIRFSETSTRMFQMTKSIINTAYSGLIARERSRIFSEQLYRINEQLQEQTLEIEKRALDLNKQKLILEDTTKKLKNKNEELEIQKKVVERANKDLESFSYSVSHDLRAPLRAIKGFSDILIEEYSTKLGPEGTDVANVIVENTDKMSALIKDLLELSRVGRKSRNVSVVNMKEMANSMYHEVADDSIMSKIKLKIDNLPEIKGDPNLLRQVWANLISNAIKFSARQKEIKIHISAKNEKGQVVYSVKDNGAGFDMNYKEKLFGVFQRLHSDDEFEGTGVGLAIVKQIINKHNGEIWAESKIDKGSTFYFSLPK